MAPNERVSRRAPTSYLRRATAQARDFFALARDVLRTDRAGAKKHSG